jgi:hypothetical protein
VVDQRLSEEADVLHRAEDPEAASQAEPLRRGAADERAGDQAREPDRRGGEPDVFRDVALGDEERADEGGRQVLAELVEEQEAEDGQDAVPPEEVDERPEDGLAQRAEAAREGAPAPATTGRRTPSGTNRSATAAKTGGQPRRCPSVIETAPARSTAVRAKALRARRRAPARGAPAPRRRTRR